MKSLRINDGFDVEVIPSSALVRMEILRLSREQGKPVTVSEPGIRWFRAINRVGLVLAVCLGLMVAIRIIVSLVKP